MERRAETKSFISWSMRRALISLVLATALLTAPGAAPVSAAAVLHVDVSATGADDGTSWTDAFDDLQSALAVAVPGDQILVAEGTYHPHPTDRMVSFGVPDGVVITGGFQAGGGAGPNPDLYPTLLDGDIDSDPATLNSQHVVIAHDLIAGSTLANLSVINGEATGFAGSTDEDEQGGGVRHDGGNLTLDTVTLRDNEAYEEGGGVYTEAGTLTVTNSLVIGNRGEAAGGGIANIGSAITITGSVIEANEAGFRGVRDGGGIYQFDGSLSLTDTIIDANTATESGGWGGGIYMLSGTADLLRTDIINNSATTYGGALIVNATVIDSDISSNTTAGVSFATGGLGGAFFSVASSTVNNNVGYGLTGTGVDIDDSTIDGNTSDGVAVGGSGNQASTIDNTQVTNNGGFGIVASFNSTVTVTNTTVSGTANSAVQFRDNAELSIIDSTIVGPIYSSDDDATLLVSGTEITSVFIGIFSTGSGVTVTIVDSDFIGAEILFGGTNSTLNMTDSTITDVETSNAAITMRRGTSAEIRNSTITNTTGPTNFTSFGGAIWADGVLRLIDSEVTNNTGYRHAGVSVADEGQVEIVNSVISGNQAQNEGGGVGVVEGGELSIVNSLVVDNEAFTGAGIHSSQGVVSIVNTTVTGNTPHPTLGTAGIYHGAFNAPTATMEVRNSIVHGNDPGFGNVTGTNNLTIEYSNIEGGFAGTGNIDADPLFIDADYRVDAGSPLIDAGDPSVGGGVPADIHDVDGDADLTEPTPDLDLAERIQGTVDMGAYEQEAPAECNGLIVTVDIGAGDLPTSSDDVILGTAGDDVILAGDGDDTVCALGGDDDVIGGDGNDWVDGGDGDDQLSGNAGDDIIVGGAGADTIFTGSGDDMIDGGAGDDLLGSGSGSDVVEGGVGGDTISGGSDNDLSILGQEGDDFVNGGGGDDASVRGGPGSDSVSGNGGKDNVYGDGGDDTVRGGQADDQVFGGDGADFVSGNQGDDLCDGGPGTGDVANTNSCETIIGIP